MSLSVYKYARQSQRKFIIIYGTNEIRLFVGKNLGFLMMTYLALDILGLVLVIIVLHAELKLLDERFL